MIEMLFLLLRAGVLFGLSILFITCSSEHEISFRVCGDVQVPGQIDAVRLVVLDEGLKELRSGLFELQSTAPESSEDGSTAETGDKGGSESEETTEQSTTRHRSLPIVAALPTSDGSGFVRVQGLLAGIEVARVDRKISEFEDVDEVQMPLTVNCYKRIAPLGQTCVGGKVKQAPGPKGSPRCADSGGGG